MSHPIDYKTTGALDAQSGMLSDYRSPSFAEFIQSRASDERFLSDGNPYSEPMEVRLRLARSDIGSRQQLEAWLAERYPGTHRHLRQNYIWGRYRDWLQMLWAEYLLWADCWPDGTSEMHGSELEPA